MGKEQQARYEISTLKAKVSTNYRRNPKGSLDYGPEAGESRYRSYVDYLQLCETLSGFQASISKDDEAASKHVMQAHKLRNKLSPEAAVLVAEIKWRSEAAED